MKKILSVVLATAMMLSMTINAFATGTQSGTSTVTAVVPEPTYNIHIPADMTLEYGIGARHEVGKVYVTDVKNLADGALIVVSMKATSLESTEGNVIPVVFEYGRYGKADYTKIDEGSPFVYSEGECMTAYLYAQVTEAAWKAAKPGTYTSTITYNFIMR